MNSVNVIGRVGGEIELRYTPSGKAVAEINLAVDDGWGENKKTVWLVVVIWGATAELAARSVNKGDRLGITGRLSQDEWEDKQNGKKQRKTKVTCEAMHLLQPKQNVGNQQQSPTVADKPQQAPQTNDFDEQDEIPF